MLEQKRLSLESEIEAETDRLSYAQKVRLESEANTSNAEIVRLQKIVASISDRKSELESTISTGELSVDRVRLDIDELSEQLDVVRGELSQSESELSTLRDTIDKQTVAYNTLKAQITDLREEKVSTENDIIDARERLADLTNEITALDASYTTKKAEKDAELVNLEGRLQKIKEDIVESINEDEKRRNSLATMEQVMQERDRNLRIRESKVEDGEGHILRNSNLMKL